MRGAGFGLCAEEIVLIGVFAGGFRRPGGEFLSGCPERNQRGTKGRAQDERFALIFAHPLDPHYGGRLPERVCVISGAQKWSGFPRFLPGHWALALQKLELVQFKDCAWLCRAGVCWSVIGGLVWDRLLRKEGPASVSAVGAGHGPARQVSEVVGAAHRAARVPTAQLEPHQLQRRASD